MTHVPYLAHRIHCNVPYMAHLAAGGEIRVWRRKVNEIIHSLFLYFKGVVVENQTSFDKISAKFFLKILFFLTENGFKRVEIMWATWSEKNILSKNCRNLVSKWS